MRTDMVRANTHAHIHTHTHQKGTVQSSETIPYLSELYSIKSPAKEKKDNLHNVNAARQSEAKLFRWIATRSRIMSKCRDREHDEDQH